MSAALHVLQPGEPAPELTLPTVNQEGAISLGEFRAMGLSVLIAFMRGLHCPFSRRQISILSSMKERLEAEHAQILIVVNTTLERARLYFRYWPTQVVLVADPGVETHRLFGLGETTILPDDTDPSSLKWPQTATMAEVLKYSVTGHPELPRPMNIIRCDEDAQCEGWFPDDRSRLSLRKSAPRIGDRTVPHRCIWDRSVDIRRNARQPQSDGTRTSSARCCCRGTSGTAPMRTVTVYGDRGCSRIAAKQRYITMRLPCFTSKPVHPA